MYALSVHLKIIDGGQAGRPFNNPSPHLICVTVKTVMFVFPAFHLHRISDNLEKRGFLKGVVNKNLLEDAGNN